MTPKGNSASIPASEAHSPQEPETSVKLVRRRREASLQPYLSVVVATRNDDHGVDLLRRTQIFLDGLAAQAQRHRVDTELVVVEWNPPADRPPLAETLAWPEAGKYFSARIVTVPENVHRQLDHADRLPLFQMIAKNVGIRRARGEFVLATNVDLLFSDELMSFLARRTLRRDRVYRVDRYDAAADVPYPAPVSEQLAWCEQHLVRICRREGTYDLVGDRFYRIYEDLRLPLWAAPWARLLRNAPVSISLYVRAFARLVRAVAIDGSKALGTRLRLGIGWFVGTALLPVRTMWQHGLPRRVLGPREFVMRMQLLITRVRAAVAAQRLRSERGALPRRTISLRQLLAVVPEILSSRWAGLRLLFLDERARMRLHTNACGDFTLLSREGWALTHAYPELQLFSMHIDSLFMYEAHYHGIPEEFLPFRAYHIEHSHGFRPDEESVIELASRLEKVAIPQISNEAFLRWVIEMHKTRKPRLENDASWGFSELVLPDEVVVERAQGEVYA
jgi:hypothetical protein